MPAVWSAATEIRMPRKNSAPCNDPLDFSIYVFAEFAIYVSNSCMCHIKKQRPLTPGALCSKCVQEGGGPFEVCPGRCKIVSDVSQKVQDDLRRVQEDERLL